MLSIAKETDALATLIDRDQDFRLIGSGYGFTEGPAWNPAGDYLVFSDIPGDRRWRWSEAGGMELVAWPTYKGNGMAYEADGSLLVCEQVTSSLIRRVAGSLRSVSSRRVSCSLAQVRAVWAAVEVFSSCNMATRHMHGHFICRAYPVGPMRRSYPA